MSRQELPEPLEEISLDQLREQLADLEKRLPAHSISPALMQQMDDLEAEIERRVQLQQQAQSERFNSTS